MFNDLLDNNTITTPDIGREDSIIEEKTKKAATNARIIEILDKADNIWVGADWHLWQWWDSKPWRNTTAEKILDSYATIVKQNDAYIYLGDLVADEITDKDAIRKDMTKISNGHKIMVLGNNDLFGEDFYKEIGFDEVTDSFKYDKSIFTHAPIDKSEYGDGIIRNIHGHIHFSRSYCVNYFNHADCFTKAHGCRPILLRDVYKNIRNGKYKPLVI